MDTELLLRIIGTIILLGVLVKSADLIEDGFVLLAKRIGVSEFFIGFVILSAVSSLPEFSIALTARNEAPTLAIGNLLGASIILLTLVIGLMVLKFGDIPFVGSFRRNEVVLGLAIILLGVISLLDKELSIVDSLLLIVSYGAYIFYISDRFKRSKPQHPPEGIDTKTTKKLMILFGKAILGVLLILISSTLLVDNIVKVTETLDISSALVGLFILAIGTNIPEITILIRAKRSSQEKLAFGNFIGSATMNVFTIGFLGLMTAGVQVTQAEFNALIPVMTVLLISCTSFMYFSWTDKKLSKTEGLMLLGIYGGLLISEGVIFVLDL